MIEKLKSRKFIVAVGGVLSVIATDLIGLRPEMTEWVIGAITVICSAYIGGQGLVDSVAEFAKAKMAAPKKAAKK